MICHQYKIKQKTLEKDIKTLPFDYTLLTPNNFYLKKEEKISDEIKNFIKKYEWLGSIGVSPKWIFTAYYKDTLGGVVFINEPMGYSKLLGEETKKYEALIQRGACASWTPKGLGSRLIMYACNWMVKNTEKRCFIGYSDSEAGEIGTIYQACNFDFLGFSYGNNYLYRHPTFKSGKLFSSQVLKRTSTFKRWAKESRICLEEHWFNKNGFKALSKMPVAVKMMWKEWRDDILNNSEKIPILRKGKYVLVLGKNKKEKKYLNSLKNYKACSYPKRNK